MRHSDKVAAWEKARAGARAALAEYRRMGVTKSLTESTVEGLIVKAYAPNPTEENWSIWVPNHKLARLRVAIADNAPKAQILDMVDELIMQYERDRYSEYCRDENEQ